MRPTGRVASGRSEVAFDELDRQQLAALLPELLLCGHLIDRAGMPHLLARFGRDGMRDIAIEEWQGASPHYTRRMQRALGYEGDDLVTIFKGLQLDVGAPPQFLDFRFRVETPQRGYFQLDHCGALLDVEPMGEDFVTAMCVDIEDPTMDATALATNPRARMTPLHRPPRADRTSTPHCEWLVDIDESRDPVPWPPFTLEIGRSRAATYAGASRIDPDEDGAADYAGPIMSDLDFTTFSRSALVRIAEEVCLQWHLLAISTRRALAVRTHEAETADLLRRQFTGTAGITTERLRAALGLGTSAADVAALLQIHPAFQPAGYTGVTVEVDGDRVLLSLPSDSAAVEDGGWLATVDEDHLGPIDALLHGVDPTWHAAVHESSWGLVVEVVRGEPRPECAEVALVRFSRGASFAFAPRHALPLTVL